MSCLWIAQYLANIHEHNQNLDRIYNEEHFLNDDQLLKLSKKRKFYGKIITIDSNGFFIRQTNGRLWYSLVTNLDINYQIDTIIYFTPDFSKKYKKVSDVYSIFGIKNKTKLKLM
tara:strand:+ start:99 stop:443 length:345 start_codon:yes stop_codon:yes gene_type:complete